VDIDAILDVIGKAEKFIHIAVMDYVPSSLYTSHQQSVMSFDSFVIFLHLLFLILKIGQRCPVMFPLLALIILHM